MKKYWSLVIFTKLFNGTLYFVKRESVDDAYQRVFKACTDKEVPAHIISIDDEVGNKLTFMSNSVSGIKIESINDNSDEVNELRHQQIEHMKLLNKELEIKMRGDQWFDTYKEGEE